MCDTETKNGKIQSPFPECSYETDKVTDALTTVLVTVNLTGTHNVSATAAAPTSTPKSKINKGWQSLILYDFSLYLSPFYEKH